MWTIRASMRPGAAALLLACAVMGCMLAATANAARVVPAAKGKGGPLRILALGDSITQGSVPSANQNHPYTIELKKRLARARLGRRVDITDGAVGGAGIFAVGFHKPVTLVPYARELLSKAKYEWVVGLIGINDLLRMGRSADDVFSGIMEIYKPTLESGVNVMAIAPLPAPGFVSKDDYKEGERKKLAGLLEQAAASWTKVHPQGPDFVYTDLGVNGPMDFWKMDEQERRQWLDDGLHLTKVAYDKMGGFIADALLQRIAKD